MTAVAPAPREIVAEEAKAALRVLTAAPRPRTGPSVTIYSDGAGPRDAVTVPREAFDLFLEILGHMANGVGHEVHKDLAQAPLIAGPYLQFMKALRENGTLPRRLVELLRLRVSFHNQCRTCMSIRYADGLADGITEGLVCSLERPEEADDLTHAEKAALAFADKMATDHLAVTDEMFARLHDHFTSSAVNSLPCSLLTPLRR